MMERQPERKSGARIIKPANETNKGADQHAGLRKCETCGNEYDKPLEIVVNGISHYFDSFECAIHTLAPSCEHCGCRIIGHGIEASGVYYCCATCAKHEGVTSVKDRA